MLLLQHFQMVRSVIFLTQQKILYVFREIQMGSSKESISILVKSIPLQFSEIWKSKLLGYFGHFFNLGHTYLLFYRKTVKKIASKHQRIFWSVDCVDPTRRNKESIASFQRNHATFINNVSKKDISLSTRLQRSQIGKSILTIKSLGASNNIPYQSPVFVCFEILFCWWD